MIIKIQFSTGKEIELTADELAELNAKLVKVKISASSRNYLAEDIKPPIGAKSTPVDRLISVREAAKLFNVHKVTLYRWLAAGALPSTKLGRRRLVAESTVQAIIARAEVAE